jgi:hypothetical protein
LLMGWVTGHGPSSEVGDFGERAPQAPSAPVRSDGAPGWRRCSTVVPPVLFGEVGGACEPGHAGGAGVGGGELVPGGGGAGVADRAGAGLAVLATTAQAAGGTPSSWAACKMGIGVGSSRAGSAPSRPMISRTGSIWRGYRRAR